MNLPELLKIAEAAKNKAVSYMDFVQARNNFERAFTPEIAEELIKRLQEAEKFIDACAGEGIEINGMDAADVYERCFPEQYAAAMNGGKE